MTERARVKPGSAEGSRGWNEMVRGESGSSVKQLSENSPRIPAAKKDTKKAGLSALTVIE